MDYDNFLLVAQMTAGLGCTVVKENLKLGKVIENKDASTTTLYETSNYPGYYFYLPETGAIGVLTVNDKEHLDYDYTATGNALIEVGCSSAVNKSAGVARSRQKKEIHRAKIYCISGHYDESEKYV